jgi:hypothetical protein
LNQTLVHYLQANLKSEVSTTDNKFVQHDKPVGVKRFHNLKRGAIQLERMELYLIMTLEQELCLFLPDYYAAGSASIPSYSPLVFSFKLFELQRLDQDGDGIPSYLEDLNGWLRQSISNWSFES